jgi:hypothetical protein
VNDSENEAAFYISPNGEKFKVVDGEAIKALENYIRRDGRAIPIGQAPAGTTGTIPSQCHSCQSSKIAIGTIMGRRFWTCSDCGTPGDL